MWEVSNAGQAQVPAWASAMHKGLLSKLGGALVVGELIQSRAGLIGAVEAVLALDAADCSDVKQFCILLALLVGDKHWPDIGLQVQLAMTVRLWAFDGVYFVLCIGPEAMNAATSQVVYKVHLAILPLLCLQTAALACAANEAYNEWQWHGTPKMCAACTTAGSCSLSKQCRCLLGRIPDKLLEAVLAAEVTTSRDGGGFLAWHLLQANVTCCYDRGLVCGPADISMS